ncbi:OB-fold nucleic acid binding domain-containing protein [Candidatus Pacearchaeota archaeon]|nr:OB-fold nucleic acid binding domain-containing protein [Candidatus Pacearchaeota archaeon]
MPEVKKRETAHKQRIVDLQRGNQIFETVEGNQRFKFLELGNKQLIRINLIANVIDKYVSDGERRFASITVDDGSGQIRARVFGEDFHKFDNLSQGDTIVIIGFLKSFNNELYILPEIIRKMDTKYLLIRKLEIEKSFQSFQQSQPKKQEIKVLRDEVIHLIKTAEEKEGIDKEEIILSLKTAEPQIISQEIQKLLDEGIIYEPRPGRVRYLG